MVDLPAPFGPRNPVTCPGRTVKLKPSTAKVEPNRFVRSVASIMALTLGGWAGCAASLASTRIWTPACYLRVSRDLTGWAVVRPAPGVMMPDS